MSLGVVLSCSVVGMWGVVIVVLFDEWYVCFIIVWYAPSCNLECGVLCYLQFADVCLLLVVTILWKRNNNIYLKSNIQCI